MKVGRSHIANYVMRGWSQDLKKEFVGFLWELTAEMCFNLTESEANSINKDLIHVHRREIKALCCRTCRRGKISKRLDAAVFVSSRWRLDTKQDLKFV